MPPKPKFQQNDIVDAAFDVFDDARNDLELFPEVRPALESLRKRFVLVAVTNGNANLETTVRAHAVVIMRRG